MRSPRAVSATAKLLILLTIAGLAPIAAGEAATKCPSGQILRVTLGTCVSKEQNLSLLSQHVAKKPTATKDAVAPGPAPEPAEDAAASANQGGAIPLVEVAERETRSAAEQPQPVPPAQHNSAPLAAFGSLFVGAFRSSMNMGASAFK
jgi:hypothetical protein